MFFELFLFFFAYSQIALLYLLQQMALLGFSYHLMPRHKRTEMK